MDYPRPYAHKSRTASSVTNVVIHQSVTTSAASTQNVLSKKGCGVHVMIGGDGQIIWEHPPTDRLIHTPRWNTSSIGIELVNPVYPASLRPAHRWTDVIEAPWAHKGFVVLETPEQLEALWTVIQDVLDGWEGVRVPGIWRGLTSDVVFSFVGVKGADPRQSGIWSHHQTGTGHSDGSLGALYSLLRFRGYDAPTAYRDAVGFAKGCKGVVLLPWGAGSE